MILDAALANLLSPIILCFVLGLVAGAVKSDLEVPAPIAKGLSLYLMLAIGLKGGWSLAASGAGWSAAPALLVAALLSLMLPLPAYAALRSLLKLDQPTAAAIAAHYGSISIVTFASAQTFLAQQAVGFEGYVVAMVAIMETPAIVTGIYLAHRGAKAAGDRGPETSHRDHLLREVLFNGSVMLLVGGLLIGWATGARGEADVKPFFNDLFKGALCLFLLDIGLTVARRGAAMKRLTVGLVGFGVVMPLMSATAGLGAGLLLGLSLGGVTLLMLLCASASYIAVPAAMRLAVPKADPAIYMTLSLAVTFPFNIVLGVPLYYAVARWAVGG
ncbi:membrane protein [Elstera litoralis]|uniref:Membrane protein n=1 Tax=Elstera litoralis TaxID=552518 RepID=A0A0F3IP60_9PROT|nr:sodium-dependent bicarbonate transport family permease [Elstera litoralis]KJV08520.1 membrane protein [Elstera litoralis]